jgi:P4 family phage/plasmid primase-like protien
MNSLDTFLNTHKSVKGGQHTHTRIGNKEFNVFGGSYLINNDEEETFYKAYYEKVFTNKKQEYLTEKQIENGVLAIDLDLHYSNDVELRQHNKDFVDTLMQYYVNNLKKYFDFNSNDTFKIYVMERIEPCLFDDKTKDGLHIIFGLNLNRRSQIDLRNRMIKQKEVIQLFDTLPLINNLDGVFDEGITKGCVNWNLYGSRKPSFKQYLLTYLYECVFTDNNEYELENIDFEMNYELFKELIVRNTNRPQFNEKLLPDNTNADAGAGQSKVVKSNITQMTEIEKYVRLGIKYEIFDKMSGHITWINIGFIIKNELGENGEDLFVDLSRSNEKFEEDFVRKTYRNLKENNDKKPLTIATLIKYFKEADKDITKKIIKEFKNQPIGKNHIELPEIDDKLKPIFDEIEKIIELSTETQLAKSFIIFTNNCYKCVDSKNKIFYVYEDNIWTESSGGHHIRNSITDVMSKFFNIYLKHYQDFLNTIDETYTIYDEVRKKINKIADLIVLVGKTNWKTNIFTELSSLTYDANFEKFINRKIDYLPTKNGLLNINTLTIEEGKKEDYFSYKCNANFIPYNEADSNFQYVDKYFNDLFCNNQETKKCVIDILKSCLTGRTLRFIYFLTGVGSNGKSLLLKVLSNIFNDAVDTISKLVVIKQKGNHNGTITTELEKLDKCRLGVVSELTNKDELNATRVKEITGGDKIDFRGLFKSNKTIIPTCNMFCATNQLPTFEVEKAILNRLIIIPFNNVFKNNPDFENELISRNDYIFSYIMCKGELKYNFDLSEEMKLTMNDYQNENTDRLKEFADSKLQKCINDKTDKKPIKIEDFREQYNIWCKKLSYPLDKRTKTAFTKALKSFDYECKESNSVMKVYGVCWVEEDNED